LFANLSLRSHLLKKVFHLQPRLAVESRRRPQAEVEEEMGGSALLDMGTPLTSLSDKLGGGRSGGGNE